MFKPEPEEAMMPQLDSSTRDRIVSAATELIMERGYEKTTMRAIAQRAEVSLGSTYYYFGGKEDLVQGFYTQIANEHHATAMARLEGVTKFGDRLAIAMETFLDTSDNYRAIADSLLSLAIVPRSPLSPFSEESRLAREKYMALYREVVEGSDLKTDARLHVALPELLWIAQMLVLLGWVQDLTPGQQLTRTVVAKLIPSAARLLGLARLAPLRPFVDDALEALEAAKASRTAGVQA